MKRTVTLFSLHKMQNRSAAGVIQISSQEWPIECKANLETRCGAALGRRLDPHHLIRAGTLTLPATLCPSSCTRETLNAAILAPERERERQYCDNQTHKRGLHQNSSVFTFLSNIPCRQYWYVGFVQKQEGSPIQLGQVLWYTFHQVLKVWQ